MGTKYEEIAARVRRDIEEETHTDRLPSERKLAEQFKTTQVTVRKALDILVGEGLLRKEPPLGTFIERIERPRLNVSLLTPMYGPELTRKIGESFARAFPKVDLELRDATNDPRDGNEMDLLRAGNLSTVDYQDFAVPFPQEVIKRFDENSYFQIAFDIHRVNGAGYGMPLLFSPIALMGKRERLAESGISLDPYNFTIDDLLTLRDVAAKTNAPLWHCYVAYMAVRALVFSAGDDTNRLESVDLDALKASLRKFWPTLEPGATIVNKNTSDDHSALLKWCCRQSIRALGEDDDVALLALPKEIRRKTPLAGEFLLLNHRCRHPETAAEVAAHFLSPEIQRMFGEERIGIPVLKSAAIDSLRSDSLRDDLFFNEVRNIFPNNGVEREFLERLRTFVYDAAEGKMDFDGFVQCLEYEIGMAKKRRTTSNRTVEEDYPVAAPFQST